ncbi:nitroreductase family deazaflavin-dependent oxidoreductase [Mycobacterium sp. C31M]
MSASSSRKEHPNNAAGVPMLVPPALENFQIKYINPLITPISRKLPGISLIKHTGRSSGAQYETPVTAYRKGDILAIGLVHGKTNWVKNVLAAGEADIRVSRNDLHLVNPRVVPAGTSDSSLPLIARIMARKTGVFVADIA